MRTLVRYLDRPATFLLLLTLIFGLSFCGVADTGAPPLSVASAHGPVEPCPAPGGS